jgi:hypothetical protein
VEVALIKLWTDGLACMTKLTDAFRGYATAPQSRCIVTAQSKAKLICSGLTLSKWQAHGCENLKRILTGRKYSSGDTGCRTADVGGPTLISAATCRTEFRHFISHLVKLRSAHIKFGYVKLILTQGLFVFGATAPSGPWPPHSRGF